MVCFPSLISISHMPFADIALPMALISMELFKPAIQARVVRRQGFCSGSSGGEDLNQDVKILVENRIPARGAEQLRAFTFISAPPPVIVVQTDDDFSTKQHSSSQHSRHTN